MAQRERLEIISNNRLAEAGFVEALVRDGRIPSFNKGYAGGKERTFADIPPKGTQFGDTRRRIGGMGVWAFFSPAGEFRGFAQTIDVDLETGETLSTRVHAELEALDIARGQSPTVTIS